MELSPDLKNKLQDAHRQAESAKEIPEKFSREHLLSVALEAFFAGVLPENSSRLNGFKQNIKTVEDAINDTGRRYNQFARMFNSHVEHFPTNILARMMGLKEIAFFNLK